MLHNYEVNVIITHINGEELPEKKITKAPNFGDANLFAMMNNWHGTMSDKHGNMMPLRDPKRFPNPDDVSSEQNQTMH